MISSWRWARSSVVLTRSARVRRGAGGRRRAGCSGCSTFAGKDAGRGDARARRRICSPGRAQLDAGPQVRFAQRPQPKPPLDVRPGHFSVTEIETLRRDPYAIYARRILKLMAARPAGARPRRGRARHAVPRHPAPVFGVRRRSARSRSARTCCWRRAANALPRLALPADVEAVWWPRFAKLAAEHHRLGARARRCRHTARRPEARAEKTAVGASGVTLSGYADRVDLLPGRHGRHSRLQDRFVALQGAGAHAACAAAGAGRRAAEARRLPRSRRPASPPTSPSSG